MRISRIYLALSILSLLVGVGMVAAKDKRRDSGCSARNSARTQVNTNPLALAENALHARDFNGLFQQGKTLVKRHQRARGHSLSAYALRGLGQHDDAIIQYTTVILMRGGNARNDVPDWLLTDCYTGRAASYAALGETDRANEDIAAAELLARMQVQLGGNEDSHYQLACVYAIESSMREGLPAVSARKKAIDQLKLSCAKGYDGWDHMRGDIDLDALRDEPAFKALFPN